MVWINHPSVLRRSFPPDIQEVQDHSKVPKHHLASCIDPAQHHWLTACPNTSSKRAPAAPT